MRRASRPHREFSVAQASACDSPNLPAAAPFAPNSAAAMLPHRLKPVLPNQEPH